MAQRTEERREAIRELISRDGSVRVADLSRELGVTAVTIRSTIKEKTFSVCSNVYFKELSDSEINYYIDTCKPFDKAGAYGIQEWIGYIGITGIEGSFYNVMGFPTQRFYEELQEFL